MDLSSYCIVNTNGRELLLACLEAIRDHGPAGLEPEVLVLDNASDDGSADAVERWNASGDGLGARLRLIRARAPRGQGGQRHAGCWREARGELCLLLNEDSELRPRCREALIEALRDDPGAAAAGAQLLDPEGRPQPCAWRLPGVGTALAGALFLHRLPGHRERRRAHARGRLGAVGGAAGPPRAAERVGYLDPDFFVYSDETDFCKRLHDAGWRTLYVPAAAVDPPRAALHRPVARDRRIVEFHRNRDLYMRKHHGAAVAWLARPLTAWPYAVRALAAVALPGHGPRVLPGRTPVRRFTRSGARACARRRPLRLGAVAAQLSPRDRPAQPPLTAVDAPRRTVVRLAACSASDERLLQPILVAADGLEDLGRAPGCRLVLGARRAPLAGQRLQPLAHRARAEHRAQARPLLAAEEAGGEQDRRQRQPEQSPRREAVEALGRQQQLAAGDGRGGDADAAAPAAPTRRGPGTGAG